MLDNKIHSNSIKIKLSQIIPWSDNSRGCSQKVVLEKVPSFQENPWLLCVYSRK